MLDDPFYWLTLLKPPVYISPVFDALPPKSFHIPEDKQA
jgi:hypothetical protein